MFSQQEGSCISTEEIPDLSAPFEDVLGDATDAPQILVRFESVWSAIRLSYENNMLLTREEAKHVFDSTMEKLLTQIYAAHQEEITSVSQQLSVIGKERDELKARLDGLQRDDELPYSLNETAYEQDVSSAFINPPNAQAPSEQLEHTLSHLTIDSIGTMNFDGGAQLVDVDMLGYNDSPTHSPPPAIMPSGNETPQPTIDPTVLHPPASTGPGEGERELDLLVEQNEKLLRKTQTLQRKIAEQQREVDGLKAQIMSQWCQRHKDTARNVKLIQKEYQEQLRSSIVKDGPDKQTTNSKKRSLTDDDDSSAEEAGSDDSRSSAVVPGDEGAGKRAKPARHTLSSRSRTSPLTPQQSSSMSIPPIRIPGGKKPKLSIGENDQAMTRKGAERRPSGFPG
ncbi:unnamed protein product [Peniophora sp. CBMAI 1063]|nr:unnamed protein product [Peniophora sp. CBMAI 1063]